MKPLHTVEDGHAVLCDGRQNLRLVVQNGQPGAIAVRDGWRGGGLYREPTAGRIRAGFSTLNPVRAELPFESDRILCGWTKKLHTPQNWKYGHHCENGILEYTQCAPKILGSRFILNHFIFATLQLEKKYSKK